MIETLCSAFPNTNLIWFSGTWYIERFVNNARVAIDSIVVHSLEMPCFSSILPLTYLHKDRNYDVRGSCAEVLKIWCDEQFGAHYIISSESVQKITSDLHYLFPDLDQRAAAGKYGTYIHHPEDIALICCVPPGYAAFHAGASRFDRFGCLPLDKTRYTLNFSSIGIELQGNGFYQGNQTARRFDQFWPQQISMLTQLVKTLAREYTLNTTTDVLTHSTIAPLRKKDPGRYFPFEALAQEGIGWILKEPLEPSKEQTLCIDHVRKLLMRVGYGMPASMQRNHLEEDTDQEARWGCVLPSSTSEVLWRTLDGFALQYAPWAWHTQLPDAVELSWDERGRVVKALHQYLR